MTTAHPAAGTGLRDAALDLLLGGSCVGCGGPGRALCVPCWRTLHDAALLEAGRPVAPTVPVPVACRAAGRYEGALRAAVVAHKERGVLALARPLGRLLAVAVAADRPPGGEVPVALVPVPSRRASTRARGHDPTGSIAREGARALRHAGWPVAVAPLLRLRPGVVDQAGLGAGERVANLDGAMALRAGRVGRLARLTSRAHLVVVDDVLTTGATAAEACAALARGGLAPRAVAAVAATPRPGERRHSAGGTAP